MTTIEAKKLLIGAKWKAAFIAAESPAMGAEAIKEVNALEAELSSELAGYVPTFSDYVNHLASNPASCHPDAAGVLMEAIRSYVRP